LLSPTEFNNQMDHKASTFPTSVHNQKSFAFNAHSAVYNVTVGLTAIIKSQIGVYVSPISAPYDFISMLDATYSSSSLNVMKRVDLAKLSFDISRFLYANQKTKQQQHGAVNPKRVYAKSNIDLISEKLASLLNLLFALRARSF
jgi:hypothetical protein